MRRCDGGWCNTYLAGIEAVIPFAVKIGLDDRACCGDEAINTGDVLDAVVITGEIDVCIADCDCKLNRVRTNKLRDQRMP